jgi:hypothetical protein
VKSGDLVWFATEIDTSGNQIKCDIGLLIKYEKWEKIAYILYEGKIRRVHACYAEKAGKKRRNKWR